ncbi:MAG: CDP-glucose 4,6-dehydratase, partial [Acetobacteraceae bacterium]
MIPARLPDPAFWRDRRVFLTGHTGFKGAWLGLWLHRLGARVHGFALPPESPGLAAELGTAHLASSIHGDIRDPAAIAAAVAAADPEIVLHLAAQSLVRPSYRAPVETFATNVMGTAHVIEAARHAPGVRALVCVTSDKCYENREWPWAYRETDKLGGHDPYSASKACAEILAAAWSRSFLADRNPPLALATARAGNVIGGGDWAAERLIPDCIRAFAAA